MQLATLFHENVAVITTAADVASTGSIPKASVFKDKSIKVKDMSTFSSAALASGGKLIEHDTSNDSSLLAMEIDANEAVVSGTSGRGLEMPKRKQSFECVKPSNRQTQPKDRRIHNALWKKVKSEQQIMTVNSSNKKYLRSLIADELLNTRLHLTTESSKEKQNYHDREQNTENADYENCNNKYENTNIESGSTDNNIKQFANYIKTSLKEESSFNICTNDAVGTESNASAHNAFDRLEDEKETNVISGIASQNIKTEGGDDGTDVDGSEFDNEKRSPLANKLYTPKNTINANEIRAYASAQQSEITEKIGSNIETNSAVPVVYESCKIIDSCIEKADQLTEKATYDNSGETQQNNQSLSETTGNQHMLNDAINTGNCSSKRNDEYLRYVTFTPNRVTDVHGNEYTNNCHHSPSKSCDVTAPDNTTTYKYLNPPQPAYPQTGTCLNDKNTEVIQAINDMEKSSLDDSGPRTDMRSSSMQHDDCATYERTSSASNADGFSITDQLSAKNNMRSDNCDGSNKLNNNHWQNDDKYLDGRESTHTDENNSDFKIAENERKQLNILENKMKLQDILFSREQPQLHEFQNEIKQEDLFQRPANSYHSYSEQDAQSTNSTNADIEKQEKYYTSAINTTGRDRDIYQLADMHQQQQHQSHNQSKEQMENAADFSHIQNFENPHHMHQQKQQNYEQLDKQQQQQQQLQHLRPNQTNMQYFDQNQHFLYQQKELQTINSSYNLHQDFHNQTQSEMQKSLTQHEHNQHNLQQQPNQQQHQRHFDQPSHFMSYLNQENHFRQQQQLQRAYHQHQRMNPESNLLLSPHPNNNTRKQEIDKLQSTSLSSTNNKLSAIDELMIDEYREQNHNVEFKLTLSPTNAIKNENQDDGYETSAGDVLTPNSHSSSRHSITPQHQTQYTNNLLPPSKCGDPQFKSHPIQFSISNTPMNSQQLEAAHNIMTGGEMNQEISENTASPAVADAYNFIDDELNATANIRKTPQQAVEEDLIASERNYLPMQDGTTRSEQHQQQPSTIITSQPQDFNNRNMLNSNNNNIFDEKIKEGCCDILNPPSQKRRGRKKKVPLSEHIPEEIPNPLDDTLSQQQNPQSELMAAGIIKTKERKKHDRFNGLPEEEVAKRILPDHLCDNLDIVIVGINPGLFAAYKGHHYAGPGNHFWKCLYLSGLTHEQMGSDEDYKLVKYGIGFTNMVQRATKGSADLTRKEIKEGSRILLEKLQRYRPKIAVFNGKLIFEVFSGKKDFNFGRQPECVDGTDTYIWVMPSSSARCAQLPRAADKVPFYAALKKFRDYLNGLIPHMEESECVFNDPKLKQGCEENLKQLELVSGNSALQEQGVGGLYDTSRNILASQTPKIIDNDEHVLEKSSCVNISSQEHQQCCSQQQQMHAYMYGDNYISASSMVMPKSGPDPSRMSDTTDNRYILPDCHTLQPPQKKKRGRPKKIKEGMGQEIISPGTRNKINVSGQTQGCANDFSNILNLSMMAAVGAEIPKKKRGRPKKIKVPLNMNQSSMETRMHITNSMSVQGVPIDHVSSPKQHVLYNSPQQHNIQQGIFGHSSPPVGSPVGLHSGFTRATPPSNHLASAIQIDEQLCISQHDEKLGSTILGSTQKLVAGNNDSYYTEKLLNSSSASSPHVNQMQQHLDSSTSANIPSADSKLEESSVPNSPNICPVDFETAKATSNTLNLEKDMDKAQVHLRQRFQEYSSRYNSPTHEHLTEDHYPTNEQHFNQWPSPSQAQRPVASHPYSYNPSRLYQTQNMSYQEEHNLHHLHEQQTQYNTSFPSHWQRLQEPQCYEPNAANYLVRHPVEEHINAPEVQTYQQLSSDVTSKSLSGLESLVDQIPTISATDSVASNSLSATAAAAVETRLQSMLPNGNSDYRNSNNNICESSEMYAENMSSNITNIAKHAGDSNGSNTPQPVNNIYGSGSPGNYHTNTRNSSTPVSSPVSLRSPNFQSQTEPLHDLHHQQKHYPLPAADKLVDLLPPSTPGAIMNSSPKTVSRSTPPINSSLSGSVVGHGASYSCSSSRNISSNVHTSNFSVSHLAASSATVPSSVANINQNYLPSPTHHTIYHRSNLLPSIPPAASAHSSPNESTAAITNAQHMSSFPQMYMNPHPHLSVPVNTIYPHLHPHAHHHGHSCGPTAQHSPLGDYDTTPYGSPSAAATAVQTTSQDSPVHTLHIPSPNYPYGYATPPTQSSYTSPMHAQSTPPPTAAVPPVGNAGYHHAQHHHYHHGHNATHHLSMFERLKPTDIGSYGGF